MLVRQTEGKVRILRFLPDSRRLLVATELPDSSLRFAILDSVTGESISLRSEKQGNKRWFWWMTGLPNVIAIHPDGKRVQIACRGERLSFRTANGAPIPLSSRGLVTQLVLSPRGDRLLTGEQSAHLRQEVVAYEIGPRKEKLLWRMKMPEGFNNLAGFLPDGDRFVSIEGVVRIRSFDDGRELASARNKLSGIAQPRISTDGRILATLGYGSMYVVDLETLANPRKIKGSSNFGNFVSSAIHPSNGTIAVIHGGPTILKIYSLSTLDRVRSYKWKLGPLSAVDFSPDGLVGAVGSEDGRILVWDVE